MMLQFSIFTLLFSKVSSVTPLSERVGACSNPGSALTCKTTCDMVETSASGFKIIYQGSDAIAVRYTGWRVGELPDSNLTTDYRLQLQFTGCHADIIKKIDERVLIIDLMDYRNRYNREAIHKEECEGDSVYHMQFNRQALNRDFSNQGNDAFMMSVSNIGASTWNADIAYSDIRKCLKGAKILISSYKQGNKMDDYTKCEAYKHCNKPIDWNEDGSTTTTTTTTTTVTTTTLGPSTFTCEGTDCTLELSDGTKFLGKETNGLVEFKGIPYAEAPTGALRWKGPRIRTSYGGESFDLREDAPNCAFNGWNGEIGSDNSEDCLKVIISVAKETLESGAKVPIVYFIHGGGFNYGTNRGNWKKLVLDQGVMVISIAYRLGIYGFLYMPTIEEGEEFGGNWGLLDQNAAMEWSQTFAPHFGGDITKATLNGCSAGSESLWWHLTMEQSWPYFHRAVTVGIGLNTQWDTELATSLSSAVMTNAGCDTAAVPLDCLREVSSADLRGVTSTSKEQVFHPIKLTLEGWFSPVVDGSLLKDQLINLVRNGQIRKNTPISWNYAQHDSWGFTAAAFGMITKVPSLADQEEDINNAIAASGFEVPSGFTDQWFAQVYGPENLPQMEELFGCGAENGEVVDCKEQFSHYITASHWACNSRWAISGALLTDEEYGPIYPMQFQIRNCDPDENDVNQKSCHCSEGNWINGGVNLWAQPTAVRDVGTAMKAAWGQFYREGTFPENTLQEWRDLDGKFNVIDTEFRTEAVFANECNLLDTLDNHLWDKTEFHTTTTTTTTTVTTTTLGPSTFSCEGTDCTLELSDGTKFLGKETNGLVEFKGIPYAEAPIGALRWKGPRIRTSYGGESFDLREDAPNCAFNGWNGEVGSDNSEDCLKVIISVAKETLESGAKVPIVYFIHGGGFNFGTNRGFFKNLVLQQEVMVISIAYRLGIYGFLWMPTIEEGESSGGNWGLLDQNAAMEWSQTFAPHFGGDITKATLNGCSAGSESLWWHLTVEQSWPYFHRAVTVGIGLNAQWDTELATSLSSAVMTNAGCDTAAVPLDCLREISSADLRGVTSSSKEQVFHPIKLTLEGGFSPVVDGVVLKDQLINSVRNGHLKKNTPISWNYAQHDSWSFTADAFKQISKVPSISTEDINDAIATSGFEVPSGFISQWYEAVYGAQKLPEIEAQFGCGAANNEVIDCKEQFSHFVTASNWVCNSRWAISGVLLTDEEYGPIYPMQFQIRNCDPDENDVNQKSCHCSEGNWINGGVNLWQQPTANRDIGNAMKAAWGQFYREGTFPENTLQEWRNLDGKFNVIDTEFRTEAVFANECNLLDTLDNYLWDKSVF